MAVSPRHRAVINGLRIFWVLTILWYEFGIFSASVRGCSWPDSYLHLKTDDNANALSSVSKPAHILLVADPQIVDRHSYPSRGPLLSFLTSFLVDLNLRKSWRVALQKHPDAVVFLGDMMDNGRFAMSDEEYEEYYQRFSDIFKVGGDIPVYFIPGNHDTGLGMSSYFSIDARSRYLAHFGSPNKAVSIANHTLILFDAPSYADEDSQRHGQRKAFENWVPISGGALEFMTKFAAEQHTDPVVLFSHIPLHRPDGKSCGPLREKGSIRPGVGLGYQNMLEKKSSLRLLEAFKPVAVFSGDDHDYCEHTHQLLPPRGPPLMIREVTVKTISMVMNVRRPGFQLLSLAPSDLRKDNKHSYFDIPCLLPDQLGIYLNAYIPLLALSLLMVFGMNLRNEMRPSHLKHRSEAGQNFLANDRPADIEGAELRPRASSPSSPGWFILEGQRRQLKADHPSLPVWVERIKEGLPDICSRRTRASLRHQGWLWASLLDVWDVAVFPICTFALVTYWVVYH